MMMHKPEDHPKDNKDVLILLKGEANFKVGFHECIGDKKVYAFSDGKYFQHGSVEMWCDIPTKDTIHKINKL
jgi:hypothetical protein